MSHYQQRNEKDCLNCGTMVEGHYCQNCGQENIIPKETFWGLLTHFVYDITHFDGKFFSTVKLLLTKPGFLSLEYIKGRRSSYLHPIRMYVFTSAFFFLIFFMLFDAENLVGSEKGKKVEKREQLVSARENLQETLAGDLDSINRAATLKVIGEMDREVLDLDRELSRLTKRDSARIAFSRALKDSLSADSDTAAVQGKESSGTKDVIIENGDWDFSKSTVLYKSVLAYSRVQDALPKENRDGGIKNAFTKRILAGIESGEKKGERAFLIGLINNLLHSFPKMLFVSLPIFALLLKLLYRRRQDLFYSDHAIYTIHLYCATFIFLLGWFGLSKLGDLTNWGIIGFLMGVLYLGIYFYQYKSLRRFYGQGRVKTILKFLLLNMLSFFVVAILITIFTVLSASQMVESSH